MVSLLGQRRQRVSQTVFSANFSIQTVPKIIVRKTAQWLLTNSGVNLHIMDLY